MSVDQKNFELYTWLFFCGFLWPFMFTSNWKTQEERRTPGLELNTPGGTVMILLSASYNAKD